MTATSIKLDNTVQAPNGFADSTTAQIRLRDILKTLPQECFQKHPVRAWSAVLINVAMVGLGYVAIALLPWFLLPLAWIFTGTALTGFFVLAHDCGHRSFAKRRWVNDLVGHVLMMPLIYPFHSWRLLHNFHHAHTNKLDVDNAWQPFQPERYDSVARPGRWGYEALRGRFWWVASIVHWVGLHFDLSQFAAKDRNKVKLSIAVVAGFAAIAFPLLVATTGIWGFIKFWLLPWMIYHFWMSTFTLVHHTDPDIAFIEAAEWDAAHAQLAGTVHCDYPRWVEFLCHDISVHIPHHISTAIPSYNLRMAHQSLKQNWGEYVQERQFSWSLMKEITERCHLHHPEQCYQSFRDYRHQK
jgi:omega-6 fatty acid desaturase (delta-12 desaturase)